MPDPPFSGEHRDRFLELLKIGEIFALNTHDEKLDTGPWSLDSSISDSATASRLEARFRAAVKKAALAAAAPTRVSRLDWWISRLVRGKRRPFVQGLVALSAEFCEELETDGLEVPAPIVPAVEGGLYRDRYSCDRGEPSFLYDSPHDMLSDAHAEFGFWHQRIWSGFQTEVARLESASGIGTRQSGEVREAYRDRVKRRLAILYPRMTASICGLAYDIAVLQANYIVDRGLRGDAAAQAFKRESSDLAKSVISFWRESSKRLGLSFKKQQRECDNWEKPFREVEADLRRLVSGVPGEDAGEGGSAAPIVEPEPGFGAYTTSSQGDGDEAPPSDASEGFDPITEAVGDSFVHRPKPSWRNDADFLKECPEFLLRAKVIRLAAIGKLRKAAAEVLRRSKPQQQNDVEHCVSPIFKEYTESVFDKMAEAGLGSAEGNTEDYLRWLKSECLPEVIRDVCTPILSHFQVTFQYVVDQIGEIHGPADLLRTRQLLRQIIADAILPDRGGISI